MFADTDAIRALGTANSTYAADLADIAAALSSLPVAVATSPLGPVGARFWSALTDAVAEGSRAVTTISDHLASSSTNAYAVASAYDSADSGAGARIADI